MNTLLLLVDVAVAIGVYFLISRWLGWLVLLVAVFVMLGCTTGVGSGGWAANPRQARINHVLMYGCPPGTMAVIIRRTSRSEVTDAWCERSF